MRQAVAVLASAGAIERSAEDLPFGAVVIVCDPDGARASDVARRITNHRTGVLVGDLSRPEDLAAAEQLCVEIYGMGEKPEIKILL